MLCMAKWKMIAFVRADGEEYKLSYEAKDVNEICNREKGVPAGWITKDGIRRK